MEVSINTRQAYSEIDEFLTLISEEQRNEIPRKLREFFKEEKDKEYHKNIDINIPIKEQNLKEETLAIIALLNLEFWCKDKEEKLRLKAIYTNNENKYQEKLREKYNPNNVFKKNINESIKENLQNGNMAMKEYKEPIFRRILNKIKSLFNRN